MRSERARPVVRPAAWLCGATLLCGPTVASGQEAASAEVAASADTVEAAAGKKGPLAGLIKEHEGQIVLAGFHLNGRFDLAYEVGQFALDGEGDPENSLKNYHHFLFITRNRADEPFSLNIEIIDLSFYEIGFEVGDDLALRFGKVLVPIGADPLFHHGYGGLSGIDQKLVPFVWAEHGVVLEAVIHEAGLLSVYNELYFVAGIAGAEDQVLRLAGAADPGTIAVGDRLRVGYDKFAAAVSFYTDRYAEGHNLFLWGLDLSASTGFISALPGLSAKVGLLRADVRSTTLGNYYHFGDYLQLDYRLPWTAGVRYRAGIITFENHKRLFYDRRARYRTADDTLAHSLTVWKRHYGLSISAELIMNTERAGEVDNDLFRLTTAIDF